MYNAKKTQMKRTILLISLMTVLSFLFVECKKNCNSKELDDKTFTDMERNIVPYNGSETLIFKNSIGDSLVFIGQGRTSKMDNRVEFPDHDEDECAGNTRNAESNQVSFKCGNTDSIIRIALDFWRPFDNDENIKLIDFSYSSIGYVSSNYFYGTYMFYSDTLVSPTNAWQNFYLITAYYNSLTLINKTYQRVYELSFFNSYGRTLYYNIIQGVVGYKESSGTIWYLDRIN